MKTAEEFREAAIKNKIHHWNIHNCSLCDYECGYIFFAYEDCEAVYDHGCSCTNRYDKSARSWEDVADHYNMQSHPDVIAKYDKFWGFNNESDM